MPEAFQLLATQRNRFSAVTCTVWGGRLCKRFCSIFSGSSLCLLGQRGTCSSAQLSVELSENMSQNLFLNLPPHTVAYNKNLRFRTICQRMRLLSFGLTLMSAPKFDRRFPRNASFPGDRRRRYGGYRGLGHRSRSLRL